ncbi:MAG: hypothetical protein HC805_05840 [Alkalinema sp. RL_2_19]|nr:hypothetical protein [Alkalinema sp. RL_2_19]
MNRISEKDIYRFVRSLANMEIGLIIAASLVFAILFPPPKEKKSTGQQFGEALEKMLKDNCGCDQKKD